jgi:fatty acid desaturase
MSRESGVKGYLRSHRALCVLISTSSINPWPGSPWTERFPMTAPRAPQWPLTPALRLAALALLFAGAAVLVQGWFSTALWLGSVVLLVLAIVKFAKSWRSRS